MLSAIRALSQVTPEQRAGLKDFFDLYVAHFAQLNEALVKDLLTHPQWGPLISGMSQETMDAQNRMSLDFMRRALVDGDWDPLLGNMRSQGTQYAQMGFSLGAALLRRREPVRGRSLDPSQSRLSWRKRVRALAVRVA